MSNAAHFITLLGGGGFGLTMWAYNIETELNSAPVVKNRIDALISKMLP